MVLTDELDIHRLLSTGATILPDLERDPLPDMRLVVAESSTRKPYADASFQSLTVPNFLSSVIIQTLRNMPAKASVSGC
jgi:hypothetical protein